MPNEINDNMFNKTNEKNDSMSNEENDFSTEQKNKLNNLQEKINKNKKKQKKLILTDEDIHEENINKKDSDYVKTPKCLINKKMVINPQTEDNKSFMDAVTLSLYFKSTGKNNTRSSKIRKYSDTINWKNIDFPPTSEDYEQLEINNENIGLNVLEFDDNEKLITYKSLILMIDKMK